MRNGLPALGGGESSGQIRMSTHLYSKRKVCNPIFIGYKLIIRGGILNEKFQKNRFCRCGSKQWVYRVMVIFLTSIVALIFIPLSPLVIMSSILSIKSYRESDVKYLLSKEKILSSLLMTITITVVCVLLAYALPYNSFYPMIFRRFCEMAGVINIYFAIKIFITKNTAK